VDLQLTDARVLVTGGTRGIGRAIVEAFLAEGARVEFCARDATEIAAVEEELAGRGDVRGTALDVRDAAGLTSWAESAAGRLGGVDAVVANVSALAVADTEENWYACFEVDLLHTVRLVRTTLPHLEASGRGSVVAISSVSGREADFAAGPYATMKTALYGYITGLAHQLAGRGVRANVVSPGNTYFEDGFWHTAERDLPDLYASQLELNPTGRMGRPEEIARSVVFLSSPASSFTTGAHVLVDGALSRGVQL
jgi:3-oxoacyl-[acyl-carrier protein] reductase